MFDDLSLPQLPLHKLFEQKLGDLPTHTARISLRLLPMQQLQTCYRKLEVSKWGNSQISSLRSDKTIPAGNHNIALALYKAVATWGLNYPIHFRV